MGDVGREITKDSEITVEIQEKVLAAENGETAIKGAEKRVRADFRKPI